MKTITKEEIIEKSIIGEFDISIYDKNMKTTTKDVVLFEERKNHIKERHPEVVQYIKYIPKIIENPDMIFKELKRTNTIWIIKKIDKNIKITIKLNTSNNIKIKNSIIQMQIIRDKEIRRYMKNGKIKKIFDKINYK